MAEELPALVGGPPIRPEGPPAWPFPDHEVAAAFGTAFGDGSWGQYLGPHVPGLETALCESHNVAHALTCATGTLAVEIALRTLGVGRGDEVILAAYEFEPSFLAVHAIGATPVLVDVSPRNPGIDLARLDAAIGPATKAVVATHLHGGLVAMSALMAIAKNRGVRVVEDAAQACGATVEGRPAGSWGDVGVLSFGGSKLLTAGRGGAMLFRNTDDWQRARLLLARGIQQLAPLSEMQAAALLPQLRQLPDRTLQRARAVATLVELLRDIPGLRWIESALPNSQPAYYKLGFYFDETAFGLPRETFVKALRAEGVAFDAGFRALHAGRGAGRYKAAGALEQAEIAGRTMVVLHHPVLSLGALEIEQVAAAVGKTYRNATRLR